jgi:Flp pilus assembly protein TadG
VPDRRILTLLAEHENPLGGGIELMKAFHRDDARERGAVAVEFALILPVLLLILFGTIQFGRVWSQHQVFQGAAREGARCAAVAASSNCVIQDQINSASAAYTPATTASVQVGTGAIVAATDPSAGCTNATKGQDVRVFWSQPLAVEIPFWSNATLTPTIEGVFRCE